MNYIKRFSIYTLIKGIFLAFIVFITLYPFIHMIAVSLSSTTYILRNEVSFYPKGFNLKMYQLVLRDPRILMAYKNTIIYVIVGTGISLSATCMGAYALSKRSRLLFHMTFTQMIMFTMFFGGGMIPTYLVVKGILGLYNNIWAVVLPGAISTFNLIIMRSFFLNFPAEIEESGYIDGMNDIQVFWYLVLPLSKAVLATIGLY
ncbi:MAG: carbohydrate ABC transporter permease, partial [Tissierella sp.]|nr:carbohydrate ABC transporter permease [Tissierella sp.]